MSELPEPLLVDIISMSEMMARDAVQTSLFSRRWRNLWRSLPYLRFDLSQFKEDEHDKFCNFVDAMLNRRETYLNMFHLSCMQFKQERHHTSVRRWTSYAILHHVRVLQVETNVDAVIPGAIFNCDSLEELELCIHKNSVGLLQVSLKNSIVYLPRLRKLHLKGKGICLSSRHFNKLLSGCPILDDLWIENIDFNYKFRVASSSLKFITIRNCGHGFIDFIHASNLVNFSFSGNVSQLRLSYDVFYVPSLTEANVTIDMNDSVEDKIQYYKLLVALSKVEKLHLCTKMESGSQDLRNDDIPQPFHSSSLADGH